MPNATVEEARVRAATFLDGFGVEAWLGWAERYNLMPGMSANRERRRQIAQQQEVERRMFIAQQQEAIREKALADAAERKRQAIVSKAAEGPVAGLSRRVVLPEEEDVEMVSDTESVLQGKGKGKGKSQAKAKAKSQSKGKGKGKAKAKEEEDVIPDDVVKVRHLRGIGFTFTNIVLFSLISGANGALKCRRRKSAGCGLVTFTA